MHQKNKQSKPDLKKKKKGDYVNTLSLIINTESDTQYKPAPKIISTLYMFFTTLKLKLHSYICVYIYKTTNLDYVVLIHLLTILRLWYEYKFKQHCVTYNISNGK